jgi:putative glutamine amidotransferase
MFGTPTSLRIGILGPEESLSAESRGCNLWATGYAAAVTAAGATPVSISLSPSGRSWKDALNDIHGIVWTGRARPTTPATVEEDRLCKWCKKNRFPVMAIDDAMHALNQCFGGTVHLDLPSERPEALQHRHPPERGLRHAIEVPPGSLLASIYGEGELVVNSEHRRGVARIARGFQVSATALDGVVEAIESEDETWFALGIQWRPASATASGLDIQLFRGLIQAADNRELASPRRARTACSAAA